MENNIIKKNRLDQVDLAAIRQLETICLDYEDLGLKLELAFKSATATNGTLDSKPNNDEFLYWRHDRLIGYLGINQFGGSPAEVNGMVHPDYRNKGVFSELFKESIGELKQREEKSFLALCDAKSSFSEIIIRNYGGKLSHTEYEMFLPHKLEIVDPNPRIALVKAEKMDIPILSTMELEGIDPEESEENGLSIFLVKRDGETIGKIHLQTGGLNGGIYGFYIKPEYRGKTYGRSALALAVAYLRGLGVPKIHLQVDSTNANAIHLYRSFGFVTETAMDYYQIHL